jgi:hypothetical protein
MIAAVDETKKEAGINKTNIRCIQWPLPSQRSLSIRFSCWRYIPSHRKKTRRRPFLSHAGRHQPDIFPGTRARLWRSYSVDDG